MWYVRDILYEVLYVRVSRLVVRGCAVSRRYINFDLQYDEIYLTFTAGCVSLCCVCEFVVVPYVDAVVAVTVMRV